MMIDPVNISIIGLMIAFVGISIHLTKKWSCKNNHHKFTERTDIDWQYSDDGDWKKTKERWVCDVCEYCGQVVDRPIEVKL